ncbi:MAG: hypothetical protein HC901_03060 [Bdellovibrionaceae bacterium]|nr:hypothetical protein [Pseudobdellovibrionaceae bacterium]
MGKVLLKGAALELEAFSGRRMEMLVEWAQRVAGKRIVFEEERALDVAKRLAARYAVPLEEPATGLCGDCRFRRRVRWIYAPTNCPRRPARRWSGNSRTWSAGCAGRC